MARKAVRVSMTRAVAVAGAITYPDVGGLLGILTLNRIVRCDDRAQSRPARSKTAVGPEAVCYSAGLLRALRRLWTLA
jgi:hypothetical protein